MADGGNDNYELVLTAKIEEFAAKMKQAVRDLTAVTEANKKLTKEEAKLSPAQKARFEVARQLRMERTREKNVVLELASLEERRLRLQRLLNRAVASGNERRAAILRSGVGAVGAELALRRAGGAGGQSGSAAAQVFGAAAGVAGLGAVGSAIGLSGRAAPLAAGAIALRALSGMAKAATEMNMSAQMQQEAAKATYEWSAGTVETLSNADTSLVTAWLAVKKAAAESAAFLLNALGVIGAGVARYTVGLFSSDVANAAEEEAAKRIGMLPKWFGGLGGMNEIGVGAGENRLDEAKKKRLEIEAKTAAAKATPLLSGFDFSSMLGGRSSGAGYLTSGQAAWGDFGRIQKSMLEELKDNTKATEETTRAIREGSPY